jgi:hypothetical protein
MLRLNFKTALLATALMAAAATDVAFAQLGATYDPAQLPTIKGKVVQYLPTPRGDVDGLILDDGTEVQVGPAVSAQLVFVVKPGDSVTIHGLKARALPMVAAVSITNDATGATVLSGGPRMQPSPQVDIQGKVRASLHDPRGETNGVLLDDGTVVRLPPPEVRKLGDALAVGHEVVVHGFGYAGPLGKAVAAREIGPDATHLTRVAEPHPGWGREHGMWHWGHDGDERMMHGPDGKDGAMPPPPPPPPPPQ